MPQSILVFDSGVGGLSVLNEIQKQLPDHRYYYLFDNARLPYGTLAEDELIRGAVKLITSVAKRLNLSLVVIACNTASTLILDELRQQLDVPIVGVVPAIKPAALQSSTKHIGVLATSGTIERDYTQTLINNYASDCKVSLIAANELVALAEEKLEAKPLRISVLKTHLKNIQATDIDVLVLGCTHFPLLKAEIQQIVGEKVILIDSGEAIANRVVALLKRIKQEERCEGTISAWYTTKTISHGLSSSLKHQGVKKISPITKLLG